MVDNYKLAMIRFLIKNTLTAAILMGLSAHVHAAKNTIRITARPGTCKKLFMLKIPLNANLAENPLLRRKLQQAKNSPREPNPFFGTSEQNLADLTRFLADKVALNSRAVQNDSSPKTSKAILEHQGITATGAQLFSYITRTLEWRWSTWLDYVRPSAQVVTKKVNPKIHRISPFATSTKEELQKLTLHLNSIGVDTNGRAMQRNRTEATKASIYEYTKIDGNAAQLYTYIRTTYKISWTQWLIDIGLKTHSTKKTPKKLSLKAQSKKDAQRLTPEKLNEILLTFEAMGLVLSPSIASRNNSMQIAKQIQTKHGLLINPQQAYTYVNVSLEKNWIRTLHAAGVDISKVPHRMTDIKFDEIVAIAQMFNESGNYPYASFMKNDSSKKSAQKIYERFGIYITPRKAIEAAYKMVDTWDEVLVAGKITSKLLPEEIDTIIKGLIDSKINLANSRMHSNQKDIKEILDAISRLKISPRKFITLAIEHYGLTWKQILLANNYKHSDDLHIAWSKELLSHILKIIHINGVRPNVGNVRNDPTGIVRRVLRQELFVSVEPNAFVKAAEKHFREWDDFLYSSGLDAETIRLKGFAKIQYISADSLRERRESETRREAILGEAGTAYGAPSRTSERGQEKEIIAVTTHHGEEVFHKTDLAEKIAKVEKQMKSEEVAMYDALLEFYSSGEPVLSKFPDFYREQYPDKVFDTHVYFRTIEQLKENLKDLSID